MGFGMMMTMLFWIIVIGFAIYGFIMLIMKPFENKSNSVLTMLKERLAKDDISVEEYEEKRWILKE
jgi:putative membrane protein